MYCNFGNIILYTHYVSSSASPEHEGCWSSCCIVGKGRYWEFGGNWRQSLRGHYRVPSAARCSNTSGGPEGSSHSCTISHMLYRGRCPLKHRYKHVYWQNYNQCLLNWSLMSFYMQLLIANHFYEWNSHYLGMELHFFFFSSSEVELKWLRWIAQFLNPIPIGDISEGALGVFGTAVCQFNGRRWRSYSNTLIKRF